jgi:hypothetical protein
VRSAYPAANSARDRNPGLAVASVPRLRAVCGVAVFSGVAGFPGVA